MNHKEKEAHISWLENLLRDFREATEKGKKTNSNEERAKSISEIEEITRRLETYIRNNEDLLEIITGSRIELARESTGMMWYVLHILKRTFRSPSLPSGKLLKPFFVDFTPFVIKSVTSIPMRLFLKFQLLFSFADFELFLRLF